jgi:aminopeptidase YwaD
VLTIKALLPVVLAAAAGCVASNPSSHPAVRSAPPAAATDRPSPAGKTAESITELSVRSHMTFLASDAMNGRGSGTRDEWIAAEYLASHLQRWGIEPLGDNGGFVQQVEMERIETTAPPRMTIGNRQLTHGREILVQRLGGAQVTGPLQKLTPGAQVSPGAVVLMPETPAADQSTTGAVAVLSIATAQNRWPDAGAGRLPSPPARMRGVTAAVPSRPTTVALDKATYAEIAALAAGTTVTIEADVKTGQTSKTWNAVGRIRGSDPASSSEVILLSAHLDHVGNRAARDGAATTDLIYNGADDDASGSVAVLELAQALARGPRPKRTIVFAFFGSEEAGGYGSRFFTDRPVVPLSQIVANLQFEMIGRPDAAVPAETLWLTGYERSTLGPALAKQRARLVQDPHPEQNFFTRSDNIQFARRGVVAHTVSSFGLHKEYHQASDENRYIDFVHMTQSIRSMLEPIVWLANSGFRPEWLPGKKP